MTSPHRKQLYASHNREHITSPGNTGSIVGLSVLRPGAPSRSRSDPGLIQPAASSRPMQRGGHYRLSTDISVTRVVPCSAAVLTPIRVEDPLRAAEKVAQDEAVTPIEHHNHRLQVNSDSVVPVAGARAQIQFEYIAIPANIVGMAEKHARFQAIRHISRKTMLSSEPSAASLVARGLNSPDIPMSDHSGPLESHDSPVHGDVFIDAASTCVDPKTPSRSHQRNTAV